MLSVFKYVLNLVQLVLLDFEYVFLDTSSVDLILIVALCVSVCVREKEREKVCIYSMSGCALTPCGSFIVYNYTLVLDSLFFITNLCLYSLS